MKRFLAATTALTLLATPLAAFAQPHRDHGPDRGPMMMRDHGPRWSKGGHIGRADWGRGMRVDYRHYHLSRPPRGYEWRRVDDSYVLAAVATGLIASVVLANR